MVNSCLKCLENVIKYYSDNYGITTISARIFNISGPGQHGDIVPAIFFKKIKTAIEKGEKKILVGRVNHSRDFTDIRDVVNALWLLSISDLSGVEYVNISSGEPVQIYKLIDTCVELMDASIDIESLSEIDNRNNPVSISGNNKRLIELTGWKRMYSFKQSLMDQLNDYGL